MVEYYTCKVNRWYSKNYIYNEKENDDDDECRKNITNNYLEFLDLYAGPEYCFYYKCANINMMVFITLLFGSAMPMLYIICLFSIGIQYFIERLSLTYFYRLPPKFNDRCTMLNIKLMSCAPLLSLFLTFWLYTNKQMFDNVIDQIKTHDEVRLSHHFFSTINFDQSEHGLNRNDLVALVLSSIFVCIIGFVTFIRERYNNDTLEKFTFRKRRLPNYYKSMKFQDCQEVLEDED